MCACWKWWRASRSSTRRLQKYPTAPGLASHRTAAHLPPGEAYVETECPRGQMGFYVVGRPGKDAVPLRVRARSSSFCNLSVDQRDLPRLPDRRRAGHHRVVSTSSWERLTGEPHKLKQKEETS